MKGLLTGVLTLSLCLPAVPAFSSSGELSALFDGAPAAFPASPRFRLETAPGVPPEIGTAAKEPVPKDIEDASKTWANDVQFAKLIKANPRAKESFSFAVLGDIEPGRFPWQRVFAPKGAYGKLMALIHAKNPDLVVQLGDFVSKGTVKNYRKFIALLETTVTLPYLAVIGNHDRPKPNDTDGDKTLYRALFGDTDFYYDYNGARFIALDTSNHKLTPGQLVWLEAALTTPNRRLIFTHIPPVYLKKLIKVAGSDGVKTQGAMMSGYFTEGSDEFERLITAAGVDRVYMGHIHAYGTADRKGIRYVLSGSGGSPLYPLPPGYPKNKFAHFVLVTLSPSGITDQVFMMDGSEFSVPESSAAISPPNIGEDDRAAPLSYSGGAENL